MPDPAETATTVNQGNLSKNKLLSDIRNKETQLKQKPEFDKVGRQKLSEEIAKLYEQYNT